MSNIKVSSLSEYMSALEKYDLKDHISRGESRGYDTIIASAFRPYQKYKEFFGPKQLDEFYNYIGNDLSSLQTEHFTALAQHSGLPTHLIDFSYSPLVSLFFACNCDEADLQQDGFIYFIAKHRLLGLDPHIKAGYSCDVLKPVDHAEGSGVIDFWVKRLNLTNRYFDYDHSSFLMEYQKTIHSFLNLILNQEEYFDQSPIYFKIKELLTAYKKQVYFCSDEAGYVNRMDTSSFDEMTEGLLIALERLCIILEGAETVEDIIRNDGVRSRLAAHSSLNFMCGMDFLTYHPIGWKQGDYDEFAAHKSTEIYLTWERILEILCVIAMEFSLYSTKNDFYLPFYGTYSPPNISGRVLMQNSIFICQLHHGSLRHLNEPEPWNILTTQQIHPDFTIQISNKEKVLRDLDTLGINLKTIFGDYDNIAKYIKNSYLREMHQEGGL